MKLRNIKRIVTSIIITSLTCIALSLIIYQAQSFQNWLNSEYTQHKQLIIIGWFLLFAYYSVCLFNLWQTDTKEKYYLFLFGIQFFAFAVYSISLYCFSAYALATVGSILCVIFSFWLAIKLFKNKQYVLMFLIIGLMFIYLYCAFCGVLYCSIEYGVWKD